MRTSSLRGRTRTTTFIESLWLLGAKELRRVAKTVSFFAAASQAQSQQKAAQLHGKMPNVFSAFSLQAATVCA